MTLPASGAMAMSAIQTELGGSNPISISEYRSMIGLSGSPVPFSAFYGVSATDRSMTYLGDDIISTPASVATGATRTVAGLGSGVTVTLLMTVIGGIDGGCSYKKNTAGYIFVDQMAGSTTFTVTNGDQLTFRGSKGSDPPPQTSGFTLENIDDSYAVVGSGTFGFT